MAVIALLSCGTVSNRLCAQHAQQDTTIRDETIYDGDVLLVHYEDLAYPKIAKIAHIEGVVVIRAKLDGKGNVVDASALAGPKPLLPDCLANIRKWRFQPNPRQAVVIVYDFRLADGICNGGTQSFFQLLYPNFASITSCGPGIQTDSSLQEKRSDSR